MRASKHFFRTSSSRLRTTLTDGRVTTGLVAPSELVRLNAPQLSIARAAALQPQEATFLGKDGTPRRTRVYAVTPGFFEVFGLPMTLGPGFTRCACITAKTTRRCRTKDRSSRLRDCAAAAPSSASIR